MSTFINPTNGHEEKVRFAFLWALLFGPFYFGYKGAWFMAFLTLVLSLATGGLALLLMPFFAKGSVEKQYLRKGWKKDDQTR